MFNSNPAELAEVGTAVRNYVEAGGYMYASDWAFWAVEAAFPNAMDMNGGNDLSYTDVFAGQQGIHAVAVTDLELQAYTGAVDRDHRPRPALLGGGDRTRCRDARVPHRRCTPHR